MTFSKVKGWITLQNPRAEALGLKIGLLKGDRNYTKFIILGRSRTGSNFLRGFLKNHLQVISLGEIFRETDRIEFDSPYFSATKKIMVAYRSDPVEFLKNQVFRKFRPEIAAVGFKLFYYHASMPPFKQIWEHITNDETIHILHIKRNNMLATHLSRVQADQNNRWVNITGEKEKQSPVVIDPRICQEDFETTAQWEEEADERFKHHPMIQICYEDLVANMDRVMRNVQEFLGLEYQALTPQTYKQSALTPAQSISNYPDLKEYFSGSRWESFFSE